MTTARPDKIPSDSGSEIETSWVYAAALSIVVAAGAFLRFWNLGFHSLWLDEAWLANSLIDGKTLSDVVFIGPGNVPNSTPFLTSIAIHFVTRVAGDSEWSLRFLPALFSVAAIVTMYALVRQFGGARPSALLASMLMAFNPAAIDYAQELKQYAGDTFWLPLFFVCVLSFVRRSTWRGTIALGIGGLVMLGFSQVIVPALPGASILILCSAFRQRDGGNDGRASRGLLRAFAVIAMWGVGSLAMYYLILRHQSSDRLVNFWKEYFPASARPGDVIAHGWVQTRRFFEWFFDGTALAASIVAAIGLIYLLMTRFVRSTCLILLLWFVALGLSALRIFPFGGVRVNLYMLQMLLLAVVFGFEAIVRCCRAPFGRRDHSAGRGPATDRAWLIRAPLAISLALAAVGLAVPVFARQFSDPKQGEELRPLMETFLNEYRAGDAVVLYDGRTEPAFDYYTRRRRMSYDVLRPVWPDEEILDRLSKFAAGHRRVWLPMGRFDLKRAEEVIALIGRRWPSLVVIEGHGSKLAFFESDVSVSRLSNSSFDVLVPNHDRGLSKLVDGDPSTRWSSDGPRQVGWSMEIGFVKATEPSVVVIAAPNFPPDWSRELHVSYERSKDAGWSREGVSVHEGPRTVILFDSAVGSIERVRVTNLETSKRFHWSIHEIEVWVPQFGEDTERLPSE